MLVAAGGHVIVSWDPKLFATGRAARRCECRFSPTCSSWSECPDLPAVVAERVAPDGRAWAALCRPRAVARHGRDAVAVLDWNASRSLSS
jgi:hypothetical protein